MAWFNEVLQPYELRVNEMRERDKRLRKYGNVYRFPGRTKPKLPIPIKQADPPEPTSVPIYVSDEPPTPRDKVKDIVQAAANYYNLLPHEIKSNRRSTYVSIARNLCVYLARERLKLSYSTIGGYIGLRDHTTMMHSYRRVLGYLAANRGDVIEALDHIERLLTGESCAPKLPGADK